MTDPSALARPLRRRDAEATRAAILEAAKRQFARAGYDCTLRDIAGEAGADVALVKRYFGGKEALFVAALKASFGAGNVFQSAYKSFQVLGLPDGPAELVLL